jgi:uridine kinase
MAERLTDVAAAAALIRSRVETSRPVVGISGFGGAGKSTLADALAAVIPGAGVVPGDEFMIARPCATRSDDWSCIDRPRLQSQVLGPAQRGEVVRFQVFDWESQALGPWVSLDGATAVIVEGLGLFHPELVSFFDLRVWVDVDLATATAQGLWRDTHVWNNPERELWEDVWEPNDADFFRRFRPDRAADVLYSPAVPPR